MYEIFYVLFWRENYVIVKTFGEHNRKKLWSLKPKEDDEETKMFQDMIFLRNSSPFFSIWLFHCPHQYFCVSLALPCIAASNIINKDQNKEILGIFLSLTHSFVRIQQKFLREDFSGKTFPKVMNSITGYKNVIVWRE